MFVRHGQAIEGREDQNRCLSIKGHEQAKKVALFLKRSQEAFDLVISSSAVRAKETTQDILKYLGQAPKIVEINEIYEPNNVVSKEKVRLLLKALPSKTLKYYINSEYGNQWEQYSESAFKVIQKVIAKHKPSRVLIVGHGNIINSLGLKISPSSEKLLNIYFNYCEGFEICPGDKLKIFRSNMYVSG